MKIGKRELRIPIIQGGMGVGISLSGLAGAVAACGGMGVISAAHPGYREPDFYENPLAVNCRALKEEIQKAKARVREGLVGVNIMVAMEHYADYVRAAIAAGADAIISGAGLPTELPALAQGADILLAPIVSSARAVKVICRAWERKAGRYPRLRRCRGASGRRASGLFRRGGGRRYRRLAGDHRPGGHRRAAPL